MEKNKSSNLFRYSRKRYCKSGCKQVQAAKSTRLPDSRASGSRHSRATACYGASEAWRELCDDKALRNQRDHPFHKMMKFPSLVVQYIPARMKCRKLMNTSPEHRSRTCGRYETRCAQIQEAVMIDRVRWYSIYRAFDAQQWARQDFLRLSCYGALAQ